MLKPIPYKCLFNYAKTILKLTLISKEYLINMSQWSAHRSSKSMRTVISNSSNNHNKYMKEYLSQVIDILLYLTRW